MIQKGMRTFFSHDDFVAGAISWLESMPEREQDQDRRRKHGALVYDFPARALSIYSHSLSRHHHHLAVIEIPTVS